MKHFEQREKITSDLCLERRLLIRAAPVPTTTQTCLKLLTLLWPADAEVHYANGQD